MTKIVDLKDMEEIRTRAVELVDTWLDEITHEGRTSGDYATPLTVYLSAARHLLVKAEMAAKAGGGELIEHKVAAEDPDKGGN